MLLRGQLSLFTFYLNYTIQNAHFVIDIFNASKVVANVIFMIFVGLQRFLSKCVNTFQTQILIGFAI